MPPQQTNLTSETGRDAAGLHLAAALVNATGKALADPNASIAAPRDAVSEREAAGPPVASTQSVLSLLQEYWRAFRKWRQRKRSCVSLHELSDKDLKDIGLTPADIDYVVARRAIAKLRDDTMHLWLRW